MVLTQSSAEGLNAIYWAFIAGHKFLGWALTNAIIVKAPLSHQKVSLSPPHPHIILRLYQ